MWRDGRWELTEERGDWKLDPPTPNRQKAEEECVEMIALIMGFHICIKKIISNNITEHGLKLLIIYFLVGLLTTVPKSNMLKTSIV